MLVEIKEHIYVVLIIHNNKLNEREDEPWNYGEEYIIFNICLISAIKPSLSYINVKQPFYISSCVIFNSTSFWQLIHCSKLKRNSIYFVTFLVNYLLLFKMKSKKYFFNIKYTNKRFLVLCCSLNKINLIIFSLIFLKIKKNYLKNRIIIMKIWEIITSKLQLTMWTIYLRFNYFFDTKSIYFYIEQILFWIK